MNGLKVQGTPYKEARVLFYGAGSSAVGVALAIGNLLQNKGGLSAEDARKAGHCLMRLPSGGPVCGKPRDSAGWQAAAQAAVGP